MTNYTKRQQLFLDQVMAGKNIFPDRQGRNRQINRHPGSHKKTAARIQTGKLVALAPTGIAANNIDGQTIHSMFSTPTLRRTEYPWSPASS
jgi:ATP-dependent DNA helicase PIF1